MIIKPGSIFPYNNDNILLPIRSDTYNHSYLLNMSESSTPEPQTNTQRQWLSLIPNGHDVILKYYFRKDNKYRGQTLYNTWQSNSLFYLASTGNKAKATIRDTNVVYTCHPYGGVYSYHVFSPYNAIQWKNFNSNSDTANFYINLDLIKKSEGALLPWVQFPKKGGEYWLTFAMHLRANTSVTYTDIENYAYMIGIFGDLRYNNKHQSLDWYCDPSKELNPFQDINLWQWIVSTKPNNNATNTDGHSRYVKRLTDNKGNLKNECILIYQKKIYGNILGSNELIHAYFPTYTFPALLWKKSKDTKQALPDIVNTWMFVSYPH